MTITEFLDRYRITFSATWAQDNPQMADPMPGASHWRCTFRRGRARLTVPFSMGAAHRGDPDPGAVLDCLAADAAGLESAGTFEAWAAEYGYDTDSRRAERTYRTVARQSAKLRAFLDGAYDDLLWQTERQ